MANDLNVYVGPYLKCVKIGDSPDLPENLQDLLGNEIHPDFDFIGPNIAINGIDRQMSFDKWEENKPTPIESIVREMALFETQFAHDINEIRGDYEFPAGSESANLHNLLLPW